MRLPGGIAVWSGSVKRPALSPITTPKTRRTRAPPTSAAGWRRGPGRPGARARRGPLAAGGRGRAERVERAEDLRGPALVARAQRLVVVVGQMPGLVVEGELAERAVDGGLLLAELEGGVPRGDPAGGSALAPARQEGPEDEGEGRDDDQRDGDGLGRAHRISPISAIDAVGILDLARCALSSSGPRSAVHLVRSRGAMRAAHRLVHGPAGRRHAGRSPGPAAHEDRQHDEARREPRERDDPDEEVEALARRGEEDPEPVLVDEVGFDLFGVSPAASRSRMMPRIWFAVSDGESATDRLWQTTQRRSAPIARTAFSSTGAARPPRTTSRTRRPVAARARAGPRAITPAPRGARRGSS